MVKARWEIAVDNIRKHGPTTAVKLADRLNWPLIRARAAIDRGRRYAMLKRIGKQADMKSIYAAVQVPGWPLPAPDTERGRS